MNWSSPETGSIITMSNISVLLTEPTKIRISLELFWNVAYPFPSPPTTKLATEIGPIKKFTFSEFTDIPE